MRRTMLSHSRSTSRLQRSAIQTRFSQWVGSTSTAAELRVMSPWRSAGIGVQRALASLAQCSVLVRSRTTPALAPLPAVGSNVPATTGTSALFTGSASSPGAATVFPVIVPLPSHYSIVPPAATTRKPFALCVISADIAGIPERALNSLSLTRALQRPSLPGVKDPKAPVYQLSTFNYQP
jgi:hypothetical protein